MSNDYLWFIAGAFTGCIITAICCGIASIGIKPVIQRLKGLISNLKQSAKGKLLKNRKQ